MLIFAHHEAKGAWAGEKKADVGPRNYKVNLTMIHTGNTLENKNYNTV